MLAAMHPLAWLLLGGTAVYLATRASSSPASPAATASVTQPRPMPSTLPTPGNTETNATILRTMQTQLNALGYNAGPVDGRDGQQTQQAMIRFLTSKGLTTRHIDQLAAERSSIQEAREGSIVALWIDDDYRAARGLPPGSPPTPIAPSAAR
jgi:peptidoglycan hydrolase-like protein with peptidoglycan-binding domain